jgi:GNAT superfamily N-acetyltransferase
MVDVRRAVKDDIEELVRLRALLVEDLGGEFFNPSGADAGWRERCAVMLEEQLTAADMRILVVDGNDGLAACGVGTIERRLPGPHLPSGWVGFVLNVVTDPGYRRRGYSRAIMQGLLDWFRESGVSRVDLHASSQSEPLYRSLGFDNHPDPSLVWRP